MKYLFLINIFIVYGLQSCNVGASGTWRDENIEQSIKKEIRILDEKILEGVRTNNPNLIRPIMSDKLLETSGSNIDQLIEQVSNVYTSQEYSILNQFYVKNSTTGIGNTLISGVSGLNDYIINYHALNKEMFISLMIPKGELDEFIIANIYGKYPEGWKLNILQFGQYKVNGQTAPELYLRARDEYKKGYLADASNNMLLSSGVANPVNKFWKYQKEDEIKSFYDSLMTDVKSMYTFPLVLNEIDTEPQILSIYPQGLREGYFPMIEYLTKIDLGDTVGTKAENDKIHAVIGQTFNGIDKGKKFIFYKAFSQMPDGKNLVTTYGFVKELE